MRQRIVRNDFEVGSPKASLVFLLNDRGDSEDNYESLEEFLKVYTKDVLLCELFRDQYQYGYLKEKYYEFRKHKNNDLFVEVYQASKKYYFAIKGDRFSLYTMRNSFSVKGRRVFEWSYPSGIYEMGKTNGNSIDVIANDFKTLCTSDFYTKYFYAIDNSNTFEKPILRQDFVDVICKHYNWSLQGADVYMLNDALATLLDGYHVYFFTVKNGKVQCDSLTYISDIWWETNEEVLRDLTSIPIMKYGTRYVAQWVAPLS